jgi:hypothetical protein
MHISRTCDTRTSELREDFATSLRTKDTTITNLEEEKAALKAENQQLKASHASAIRRLEGALAKVEAENAALHAQAAAKLSEILTAVTTGLALEIQPVGSDRRQFIKWHGASSTTMPQPSFLAFDTAWCAAACADGWVVDVDDAAMGARAHVTQKGRADLTLRSAAPLPRHLPLSSAGAGSRGQGPSYRVVVEQYASDEKITQICYLGFIPNRLTRASAAAATTAPTAGFPIRRYGGWYIVVRPNSSGSVDTVVMYSGWTVMRPNAGGADDAAAGVDEGVSAYATTARVPPVPPGSAVEFTVDYAAGTCRVAFYAPGGVGAGEGSLAEAPHAKMELRFAATEARMGIPERVVPTADGDMELYPAVQLLGAGAMCRFSPQ